MQPDRLLIDAETVPRTQGTGFLWAPGCKVQTGVRYCRLQLGEYDVETRLGPIKMLPAHGRTDGERYPFAELAARFDELVSQLEGQSRKPS